MVWKTSLWKTWRSHCLEFSLLFLATTMSFYIIGLEVHFTGSFELFHAMVAGFFGLSTIVYPLVTALKEYYDTITHRTEKEDNNGKIRVE